MAIGNNPEDDFLLILKGRWAEFFPWQNVYNFKVKIQ